MEPKIHKTRTPASGMDPVEVSDINDFNDNIFEPFLETDTGYLDPQEHEQVLKEQEQRIEALKRAIDIAKLMSNVTTDDVINIANSVIDYLKNTKI